MLLDELREKITTRINMFAENEEERLNAIHLLFAEIDQDGSGEIDRVEFRFMLRALKLTYSDQRFKRLYRAIDTNGDNMIGKQELDDFLFPSMKFQRERDAILKRRATSRQSFSAARGDGSGPGSTPRFDGAVSGDQNECIPFQAEDNSDDGDSSDEGSEHDVGPLAMDEHEREGEDSGRNRTSSGSNREIDYHSEASNDSG